MKKAFTLIETILAISILALVIAGIAELTQSSLNIGRSLMNQYIAHHLAQEGLEIIRNMRDSQWLQNKEWRTELQNGIYTIVENTNGYPWNLQKVTSNIAQNENFTRSIEITSAQPNIMRIKSSVKYSHRRRAKEISLVTELTDWKKGPL